MKIVWLVLGLSALLGGCVQPSRETPSAAVTVSRAIEAPPAPQAASALPGRRIVYDGNGAFILPDGATVEADPSGGFTLPNGTRCGSDGARGYVCP